MRFAPMHRGGIWILKLECEIGMWNWNLAPMHRGGILFIKTLT